MSVTTTEDVQSTDRFSHWRPLAEKIVIPLGALLVTFLIFSVFLLALGKSPIQFFQLVWTGGFGSAFSFQNTLQRAAPLILTGMAFAIPAIIGLAMIGGEGAFVLGGFTAAAIAIPLVSNNVSPWLTQIIMGLVAIGCGAIWTGIAGWLRHTRNVNETISSLLLTYIAIAILNFFVEGLLRDPGSANKPSTMPIGDAYRVGNIPGTDVHWGLVFGIVIAIFLQILMSRTTFGFASRVTGGNPRAALAQGLPVGSLIIICCSIAGACAGLAGFFEVAAIQGQANAAIVAGYGFTGVLVSFLARHNPIVIIPVAILFGAIDAAGGLVQRRMGMPDATTHVLEGILFVVLLISETFYGRFAIFKLTTKGDRT